MLTTDDDLADVAPPETVEYTIIWQPQPGPQTHLMTCPVSEIFFGGARGGGKTDGVIGRWIQHANDYGSKAHGVIFRRRFKQLEEIVKRTQDLFPKLGGEYSTSLATWKFSNGATLKLRHLWDAQDCEEYQGHEYTFLAFEEITNWPTPDPIDKLRATLRSKAGVPIQLLLTGNPGGPGHGWVKQRYVSPAPTGYKILSDPETGLQRVFIPSKLEDNPALMKTDPTYELRLRQSGPPALVKAWRFGDWDIVAGGFFDDVFRGDRHVLRPFPIPREWQLVVSFDWGSSKPSSLGLFARVTNPTPADVKDLPRNFPRGSLIRFQEWYTVRHDARTQEIRPNHGQRLNNHELGVGIASRLRPLRKPTVAVADPSIFTEQGGPSIYDQMREGARQENYVLTFYEADNNRIAGWQTFRELLLESSKDAPERPGLWIFETCENWLRTVPILQSDDKRPDDVDTDSEDHAADDTRYALMARSRRVRVTKFTGY